MSETIHHYWGDNAQSPCGLEVAQVYFGVKGHGFTTEWSSVDCPACLKSRTSESKPDAIEQLAESGALLTRQGWVTRCSTCGRSDGSHSYHCHNDR